MTPPPEVTLVWLGPERDARPGAAHARALEAWAEARGVRLVGLAPAPRPLPYPAAVVTTIEAALARGLDAIAALDGGAADDALGGAEAALTAHPELPQASFLLAEVLRARALRASRVAPLDERAARAALEEARGLDGGRVSGLGELRELREPGEPGEPATPRVSLELASEALPPASSLLLDSRPVAVGRLQVVSGRHQLTLLSGGARVWARWFTASEGLRVPVPRLRSACAATDVLGVGLDHGRVRVPAGVVCARWAVARASGPDVELATCMGGACAPVVPWRVRLPEAPLAPLYADGAFPTWAKWTTASALTAVLAGVLVVAAGALETAPRSTRFSYGGLVPR